MSSSCVAKSSPRFTYKESALRAIIDNGCCCRTMDDSDASEKEKYCMKVDSNCKVTGRT